MFKKPPFLCYAKRERAGTNKISNSLMLDVSKNQYLSRTPGSPGNTKTIIISLWTKPGLMAKKSLFGCALSSTQIEVLGFDNGFGYGTDRLHFAINQNALNCNLLTRRVFRDYNSWYHIVVALDTSQPIASNRAKLYVNGVQETVFDAEVYPSQNWTLAYINNASAMTIGGSRPYYSTYDYDGYIADVNFIDGYPTGVDISNWGSTNHSALFGKVATDTTSWIPKKYIGTYGTNGFHLDFSGATDALLANDVSGQGNHWTRNGSPTITVASSQYLDTPTNNYATANILDVSVNASISTGALKVTSLGGGAAGGGTLRACTLNFTTIPGLWYWEAKVNNDGATRADFGLALAPYNATSEATWTGISWRADGVNGGLTNAGGFVTNNTLSFAYNSNTGKLWLGVNGTWTNSGNPAAGTGQNATLTPLAEYIFIFNGNTNGAITAIATLNYGQKAFTYPTLPVGFKALCTANLSQPAIIKPTKYFKAVYDNGLTLKTSMDAIIPTANINYLDVYKRLLSTAESWKWVDTIRGPSLMLSSDSINGNAAWSAPISDGYIGFRWVKDPKAGFDMFTYAGNTTIGRTISHSLGAVPKFIIIKQTDSTQPWCIYHASLGATKALYFDTQIQQTNILYWNNTEPTSSVFSVYNNAVNNTTNYMAYLWAEVPGFSKFGSYTGNGSTDGPFVYCGFRPAFIMVKRTDVSDIWFIWNNTRNLTNTGVSQLDIYPASNVIEGADTTPLTDYLSNGFKLRATGTAANASGGTYIFAAFAEAPPGGLCATGSNAR